MVEFGIPIDSWLLILGGFSSLFYFVSVKSNQKSEVRDGAEWFITPSDKSKLSKELFAISIILFILFLIRGLHLFLGGLL